MKDFAIGGGIVGAGSEGLISLTQHIANQANAPSLKHAAMHMGLAAVTGASVLGINHLAHIRDIRKHLKRVNTKVKNEATGEGKFLPGVRFVKGKYHAYCGERYLGCHDTEQQAHKAWLKDAADKKRTDQSIVNRWKKMTKGEREAKI